MEKTLELLDQIKKVTVLCVGDIMVDRYIYGQATRISPEAPVPVVKVKKRLVMLGGVGNVVKNLGTLGALPLTVTLTGGDRNSAILGELYRESKLPQPHFIIDLQRPTSVKTRIIAGIQQVVRFDEEDEKPVDGKTAEKLIETVEHELPKAGCVALSDYGKGALSNQVIRMIISLAEKAGKPVVIDPKGSDYSRYRGATLVTPNRAELSEVAGFKLDNSVLELEQAGRRVMGDCQLENLLITRSEDGMMLLSASKPKAEPVLLPSQAREVFDVSGAGDTVVSVMAAGLALGAPLDITAGLANLAAGVVVGKVGTASATPEEIKAWAEAESTALKIPLLR